MAAAFADIQARVVFLVLVLCGVRRAELQALRWRDVDLLEETLRVVDSKTEEGVRAIALPPRLQAELAGHYPGTPYKGADELVFCPSERGTVYRAEAFKEALAAAMAAAEVEGKVRAFHDLRHTAITHDAASGSSAIAVMTKAGHANGDHEDVSPPGRDGLPRRGRQAGGPPARRGQWRGVQSCTRRG